MAKVLITGATGFLGEYLVKQFIKDNEVYALGRNADKGELLSSLGAVFCKGDFTNKAECSRYFKDIDYVIHAGALSTVWGAWEDFYNANIQGTRNVCELCLENNVKRIVYVSSPSVYSEKRDRYDIKEDDFDKNNELNFYIKSKIASEEVLKEYREKGLYTVVIRPRGLIGVGDTSLVPRILHANNKIGIPLLNKGVNYVDITCVENVAYACDLCTTSDNINGEVFNITNGEPREFKGILEEFLQSIGESPNYLRIPFGIIYGAASLIEFIYKLFNITKEPVFTKYTVCTLGFSQTLDISKAEELLKYKPIKTISEEIKEYGEWWKNNK